MAKEVELKLSLPEYAVPAMLVLAKQDGHPLGMCQGEPLQLDNQYFDTDDLALNRSRAALRIRKSQHGYKQTLKNKGQAIAGLHQRGEWEYDIAGPQIDWQLFPEELNIDPQLKNAIKPLFKTDFTRHVWIKKFGESEIELVLDQGSIHSSHKHYPLCEIELELMSGKAEDLFGFASVLAKQLPLVPCDINKAERGYGLESNVSFYTSPDFSVQFYQTLDVNAFLQDAITRINRHWDQFSQKTDWWTILVLSRHVQAVEFLVSCIASVSNDKDDKGINAVLASWTQLKQELVELLTPTRTVIALFVDDHSHSRGLSQRLLQNLTSGLNEKIQTWMNNNTLGLSLLNLGDYLYQHGADLNQCPEFNNAIWEKLSLLQDCSLDMPVVQFQDLESIQTLAYFSNRFEQPVYSKINQVIRQHMVVMGMSDALHVSAVIDDDSRAKLASWARRITVERRRLQVLREELKDIMLA